MGMCVYRERDCSYWKTVRKTLKLLFQLLMQMFVCVHVHMCAWMFSKILNGEYVYYVEQLK